MTGHDLPLARNVQYDTFLQDAAFTVSANGILVFGSAGTGVNSELTWTDRNGRSLSVLGEPGQFEAQAISPDGSRVAVTIKFSGPREKIWIYDTDLATRLPLEVVETGDSLFGARWSPDGRQVAYRGTGGELCTIYIHNSDGSGQARRVRETSDGGFDVDDWSHDRQHLLVNHFRYAGPKSVHNTLEVLRIEGGGNPELEIDNSRSGKFSPDGHWIAYSDETSHQVYVTPFPGHGTRVAISNSNGSDPRWRGDGQELFYVDKDHTLISVRVHESAQDFRVLSSRPLFRFPLLGDAGFYDVTRDGSRFLVNDRTHKEQAAPLTLVTDWSSQLQSQSRPGAQSR